MVMRWKLGVLLLVLTCAVSIASATEYRQVSVVHTSAEGFVTELLYGDGVWTLFVTNGQATLVLSREEDIDAPFMTYVQSGSNIKLVAGPTTNRVYDCVLYEDTLEGSPAKECNVSCRPCVCYRCWYVPGNPIGLMALEYGPTAP